MKTYLIFNLNKTYNMSFLFGITYAAHPRNFAIHFAFWSFVIFFE